jgi:hypothetical protein
VRFVTTAGPEGDAVLCAFSGPEAVAARAPAGTWVALEPRRVLALALEGGLGGLVLDPERAPVFLDRDEAAELLGYEVRGRAGQALSIDEGPENALREALARLLERSDLDSHVVASEPRTGKFVLFVRGADETLMMVVRGASLSRDERARARLMFDELAGESPDPEAAAAAANEDDWVDLQAIFGGDPGRAAKAAVKIFTWAFGFPPGFELEIAEE